MKEIIIALISGLSGGLITLTCTVNHYSKKLYDKNVFQRIISFINFGSNVYNDEKKINEIVDEKTKNKPNVVYSDTEPEEGTLNMNDEWMQNY